MRTPTRTTTVEGPLKVTLAWQTARGAHVTAVIGAWRLEAKLRALYRRRVEARAWITGERDHEVGWVWRGPEGWAWACESAGDLAGRLKAKEMEAGR